MERQLHALSQAAQQAILTASDLKALDDLRVRFLGKKGEFTEVLKQVGQLSAEERPKLGKLINEIKQDLQSSIQARQAELEAIALNQKLEREQLDISLDGRRDALGHWHPITQIKARVIELFSGLGFQVAQGPEIEDEFHNFTALNIPEHHPARAMQDTFYFGDGRLLRTHTSPIQIREMRRQGVPIRLIALGRVYRRDSDQTHTPMFHQLEGLVIEKRCTFGDLKGILERFLQLFFERDLTLRFRPSFFPFTEPSAEVDIFQPHNQSWLEVLGCGMVHPNVLRQVGVDPDEYIGYAFGIGLDRLAMIRYQIPDLRLLFENDLRFLQQF
jgi:phenylalanyl-tRNA synthetase alpha chain